MDETVGNHAIKFGSISATPIIFAFPVTAIAQAN
jgi:hypothetical protein